MNFLTKFIFILKRPKIIVVTGKGRFAAAEALYTVLNSHFKVKGYKAKMSSFNMFKKEILILASEIQNIKELEFYLRYSRMPVLAVTHFGDISADEILFSEEQEKVKNAIDLMKVLPANTRLILNFDDRAVREIKAIIDFHTFSFGFLDNADLCASDINFNKGTNFKLNHKGNAVPVWLNHLFGKEQIYAVLAAASAGMIFGLNLVDISQSLQENSSVKARPRTNLVKDGP